MTGNLAVIFERESVPMLGETMQLSLRPPQAAVLHHHFPHLVFGCIPPNIPLTRTTFLFGSCDLGVLPLQSGRMAISVKLTEVGEMVETEVEAEMVASMFPSARCSAYVRCTPISQPALHYKFPFIRPDDLFRQVKQLYSPLVPTSPPIPSPNDFISHLISHYYFTEKEKIAFFWNARNRNVLLYLLLKFYKRCMERFTLCCRRCEHSLYPLGDMAIMEGLPLWNEFGNPSGHSFSIYLAPHTPQCSTAFSHDDQFTDEFTWFEGFEWCFLHCQGCNGFVGWGYRGVESGAMGFYGLIYHSIEVVEDACQ